MKNLRSVLAVASAVLMADLLTKTCVVAEMSLGDSYWIIPGFFRIVYVRNAGGAFSLLAGQTWLFLAVGILTIIFVLWYAGRVSGKATMTALGLLLGGTLGNMVDRAITGKVTDFLAVGFWPVFNLADVAVVAGVLLFLFQSLMRERKSHDRTGT